MADFESSDDEFDMDHVLTDDDDGNDLETDDDSESGSYSPLVKKRRVLEDILEENVFGTWHNVTQNDSPPPNIPFKSGTPSTGPQAPQLATEPTDFFKLFFTDELIKNIVLETNKYADNKISSLNLAPRSTWRKWKPVNFNEISAFIGVVLNMGLFPMDNKLQYWSQNFNYQNSFFTKTFRKDRFLQIFSMLRLNENLLIHTPETKNQKMNNFLSYIESKFQNYYIPRENICVDESVIKHKGKISFVTYNKNKPTKWGIRIYVMADSSNGYIYSVLPYYGNVTTENLFRPELPVSSRIVLHLYNSLLNKLPNAEGYHIYCNKYYSSLPLASELFKLKCHFTGTINRKDLPECINTPICDPTKTLAYRSNNLMLMAWKDQRIVTIITSNNTIGNCEITKRNSDGTVNTISKPKVVVKCFRNMKGIARTDQLASSYCILKGSCKWWRKLFYWGVEVCSVNAYILYKEVMSNKNKMPMSHFDFVSTLVYQLVGNFKEGSLTRGRTSMMDMEERLCDKLHFIENGKKKDCMVCSKRNIAGERRETVYFCETCSNKPNLHPGVCFKRYHTLEDYKM